MTALASELSTLDVLAATANREHRLVVQSGHAIVEHAILAGEALLEAKVLVGRGGWTRWLAEAFEQSPKTANDYMRIARYKEFVRESRPDGLNAATRLLREHEVARPRDVHNDDVRDQAATLSYQGVPRRDIAALLGTSPEQVTYLLNPASYEKRLRTNREKRRVIAAERQVREAEAQRQAVKRAARKVGAEMGDLYATAERMQDLFSPAQAKTCDAEAKAALVRAGEYYRRMRDEIVLALGSYDREVA